MLHGVGSALLAIAAIRHREWGFTMLEFTWTVVSLAGLARTVARR